MRLDSQETHIRPWSGVQISRRKPLGCKLLTWSVRRVSCCEKGSVYVLQHRHLQTTC